MKHTATRPKFFTTTVDGGDYSFWFVDLYSRFAIASAKQGDAALTAEFATKALADAFYKKADNVVRSAYDFNDLYRSEIGQQ